MLIDYSRGLVCLDETKLMEKYLGGERIPLVISKHPETELPFSGRLVTGLPAVTGYDLATGLGSPQCALIPALVGGSGGGGGGGGGGGITVNISATETQVGPDVCTNGTGFVAGGHVRSEYFGIPRRVAPKSGKNGTVKPDGSFKMDPDFSTETLVGACNAAELGNTVNIVVTETDSASNVIGTGTGTMPASYWCANALNSTNLNGGCP
jgi:hypothetical protein